ncbi:hypothetical protein L917_08815 [Phytophthora nicotianae]|uniref:Uncharacterized protein n=2 Tax=Phytophthora nicotianae TaxID=4792 RepID=W2L687_PHYNI|nr:hypothetical protein L915_09414 [Phytophthora nicotianae]ETL38859.1 hypothetical protein L916_09655 [Phytophthora nicotianae]ETL92936.1 hypothetical protein L917_08815 [Phytophthora nicotianae]ETO68685.1 hypothetical protein F444_14519 [Phytophthora nicotianae P1976]
MGVTLSEQATNYHSSNSNDATCTLPTQYMSPTPITADETEGVYKDSDDGEASAKGDERVWRLQGRDVIGWQDRLKSVQPVSGPAGGWLQLHYRKWRRRRTSGKSGHCETYADESTVEGVSCEAIRHKKSAIVGLEIAQKTDNLTQSQ